MKVSKGKVVHKSMTHPTKVSRHKAAPKRALKIKISFMFDMKSDSI